MNQFSFWQNISLYLEPNRPKTEYNNPLKEDNQVSVLKDLLETKTDE